METNTNLEFPLDSRKLEMLMTPVHPALIVREGDSSDKKLVLISTVPAPVQLLHFIFQGMVPVQPQYVIFESSDISEIATELLEINYCMCKRSTLLVPFEPDGEGIRQRWVSFLSDHYAGWVMWNKKDRHLRLKVPSFHFPTPAVYFCLAEDSNDSVEQPDLPSADMVPSLENVLSSSGGSEQSASMVEDEVAHGEKLEPQVTLQLFTDKPESDIVKLLPADPFGMGLSDSSD